MSFLHKCEKLSLLIAMQKSTGNPLVEPTPEKGRTGNILIDSDVEIKSILALPTPPSTKRKVAANFASTELAGAQSAYSPAQTPITTSAHVPLYFSSTAAGVCVILITNHHLIY